MPQNKSIRARIPGAVIMNIFLAYWNKQLKYSCVGYLEFSFQDRAIQSFANNTRTSSQQYISDTPVRCTYCRYPFPSAHQFTFPKFYPKALFYHLHCSITDFHMSSIKWHSQFTRNQSLNNISNIKVFNFRTHTLLSKHFCDRRLQNI